MGLTVVHGAIDAEAGSLARLQLNMLATFAELERDMIGDRLVTRFFPALRRPDEKDRA